MSKQLRHWQKLSILYVLLSIGFCVIIYLMNQTFYEMIAYENQSANINYYPYVRMSLWACLLGLLIEWKNVINVLRGKGKFRISLLVPLTLLVCCFIPEPIWARTFGLGQLLLLDSMHITPIKMAMTIVFTIAFVRSLKNKI